MIKKILHYIPFVHFWSNWRTVDTGYYRDTGNYWEDQRRSCKICNKTQLRTRDTGLL